MGSKIVTGAAIILAAVVLDISAQTPAVSLCLAGLCLIYLLFLFARGILKRQFRRAVASALLPAALMCALPVTLLAGAWLDALAMKKAQEVRKALLQRSPSITLGAAYREICRDGKAGTCSFYNYRIALSDPMAGDEAAYLIVFQFLDKRARLYLASGRIERSDRTY